MLLHQVKEIDTDVKGQKVLNFKGIGHGPANQNKVDEINSNVIRNIRSSSLRICFI